MESTIAIHLKAILKQLASITIQAHDMHLLPNLINKEHLLVVISTLKNWTEHEGAILIIDEHVIIA